MLVQKIFSRCIFEAAENELQSGSSKPDESKRARLVPHASAEDLDKKMAAESRREDETTADLLAHNHFFVCLLILSILE